VKKKKEIKIDMKIEKGKNPYSSPAQPAAAPLCLPMA